MYVRQKKNEEKIRIGWQRDCWTAKLSWTQVNTHTAQHQRLASRMNAFAKLFFVSFIRFKIEKDWANKEKVDDKMKSISQSDSHGSTRVILLFSEQNKVKTALGIIQKWSFYCFNCFLSFEKCNDGWSGHPTKRDLDSLYSPIFSTSHSTNILHFVATHLAWWMGSVHAYHSLSQSPFNHFY